MRLKKLSLGNVGAGEGTSNLGSDRKNDGIIVRTGAVHEAMGDSEGGIGAAILGEAAGGGPGAGAASGVGSLSGEDRVSESGSSSSSIIDIPAIPDGRRGGAVIFRPRGSARY